MSKRKAPITSILDRVKCLEEFEKEKYKKRQKPLSLAEKAVIAQVVLNRSEAFDPSTIFYWESNKEKYKTQAAAIVKRHKNDPRRKILPFKNVQSDQAFQFSEDVADHFLKVAQYKNLTRGVMILEARKFQQKHYPDLKLLGRPPKK